VITILSKDVIQEAKQIDLLAYLERYEPDELVHIGGQEYTTRTHDSLKISNGKWHWFSKGIGGKNALDYLIHVKGMRFTDAVIHLTGIRYQERVAPTPKTVAHESISVPDKADFALPERNANTRLVESYLRKRGISQEILDYCIDQNLLYESARYHNAVFVGFDPQGIPRHATQRGISPDSHFRRDASKSNKRYTFSLPARSTSDRLFVFEGAIDLLSHATIDQLAGKDWQHIHRISLGGLAPLTMDQYLKDHPEIRHITLCLDNDEPGRSAVKLFTDNMTSSGFQVQDAPPPTGKDYNEYLCQNGSRSTSPPAKSMNSYSHFLSR